ncbi:MAG: universal stress protein [Desulfobacterales bacterium]|jgi:nucleotide-binding universal stress UspA family protein|nr:universal stress protein [Desulfobacteraceae bacterium]MDD3992852.1 universal stress protein [Desulfobacteraceae bacterium]MDY0310815.1 universal stress protein [Desulfobacterales bacterium]
MKLLVGYDGSTTAEKALEIAMEKAKSKNARLYVVTSMSKGTESQLHDIQEKEKKLDDIKARLQAQHIDGDTILLIRGVDPGKDLVEFANENNVDEIFVGVKKRSRVEKMILGSTAQHVILNASCPVTTVK